MSHEWNLKIYAANGILNFSQEQKRDKNSNLLKDSPVGCGELIPSLSGLNTEPYSRMMNLIETLHAKGDTVIEANYI